jgi:excisionase family DNA binding protein
MPDQGIGGAGMPASADRTVTFRRRGKTHTTERVAVPIDEAAAMIGVSYMTLWRAIRDHEFPGIKLRGRILVPVKAVDLLMDSAVKSGELVDAPAWTAAWAVETAGVAAEVG